MIKIVRSDERHLVENETQHSSWLFSYSDYLDMENTHFGDIKVFNDDTLKAGKSFKTESVNDKEIITFVLDGELTHEDSTGTKDVLKAGDVQVLSAGSGVSFSGMNMSGKDARFCRIWIDPLRQHMEPACRKANFDAGSKPSELIAVAGQGYPGALKLRANSSIFMSKLEKGKRIELLTDLSRYIFIYVLEGELLVCADDDESPIEEKAVANDQIRINHDDELILKADTDCSFILVDATGSY